MVLIFSNELDGSTNEIVRWLNHLDQQVIRINSDATDWRLTCLDREQIIVEHNNGQSHNLLAAASYWYRRGHINDYMFNTDKQFITDKNIFGKAASAAIMLKHLKAQHEALANYIFWKLENTIPVTLGSYFKAELNRLEMYEKAASHGFRVPDFHIITNTNQLEGIRKKYDVVSKTVDNGIYCTLENEAFYSYTEDTGDLKINANTRLMPSLITAKIKKKLEVRVFFLGSAFYAMAIFSQNNTETAVDFRKYSTKKPNRNEPFQLPMVIEQQLRSLFGELQLNTGSADLIMDDDNNYYFLEINPVGQFGMVSYPCNYGLEKKIAQFLAKK